MTVTLGSTAYPYDAVVHLRMTIGGSAFEASGVMIGPDEVLTAAHAVWSKGVGEASKVTVSPDQNGMSFPYGTVTVASFHYNSIDNANDLETARTSHDDYAVLHLSTSIGNTTGWMTLDPTFQGGPVHVTGYPSTVQNAQELVDDSDVQANPDRINNVLTFDPRGLLNGATQQVVAPGSSGGPLWHLDSAGKPEVVGLVSTGRTVASASSETAAWMTPDVVRQIVAWEELDHGAAGAPIVSAPSAITLTGGVAKAVAGLSIADSDAINLGETLSVTLTASAGSLTTSGNLGTISGAGGKILTLAGSLDQINTDLAGLSVASSVSGAGSILIAANDGSPFTGSGSILFTVNPGSVAAATDDFANGLTDSSHPFGSVSVNGSATGVVDGNGDRDWFAVSLTGSIRYQIDLQGKQAGGGTLVDPYLWLHDSSGAVLAQNDDIVDGINRDSRITITPTVTGIYYVEAGAFGDSYTGSYKLGVATSDDFAGSLSDMTHPFGTLAVGGVATGTLESDGDRDWFRVTLTAGTRYVVRLQGLQAGGGTLEDSYLRVHDGSGTLLAQNDDIIDGVNRDSQLSFTSSTAGTYYIEAGAFADSYTGSYTVGIATSASIGAATITGTTGKDLLMDLATSDSITGNGGDDVILAYRVMNGVQTYGADTIVAGAGNPVIFAGAASAITTGSGNALVVLGLSGGNVGNATVALGTGSNVVIDVSGSNTVQGGAGTDFLWSNSSGSDSLVAGGGLVAMIAGSGNGQVLDATYSRAALLVGGSGSGDRLIGGAGDDTINAGTGSAQILAGAGNDIVQVTAATQSADGGAGLNTLVAGSAASPLTRIDLSSAANQNATPASGLVLTNFGNIDLSQQTVGASVTASAAGSVIIGGAGADTLIGGAGNDRFLIAATSGFSADVVTGGAGTDSLVVTTSGAVTLSGATLASYTRIAVIEPGGATTLTVSDAFVTQLAGIGGTLTIDMGGAPTSATVIDVTNLSAAARIAFSHLGSGAVLGDGGAGGTLINPNHLDLVGVSHFVEAM